MSDSRPRESLAPFAIQGMGLVTVFLNEYFCWIQGICCGEPEGGGAQVFVSIADCLSPVALPLFLSQEEAVLLETQRTNYPSPKAAGLQATA